MNVSLSRTWEEYVRSEVATGEYGNASEVVRDALRMLREHQEMRAMEEMRVAFAHTDPHGGQGEPSAAERELISQLVRQHRKRKPAA
ncbi:MAG: type II toxin-antitoxin system ParD family antitoxin [Verrucomicrobiota bacterium]